MKTKKLFAVSLIIAAVSTAQAALITTGGDPASGTGSVSFGEDVVFNITVPQLGLGMSFLIKDAHTGTDGSLDFVNFSGLQYSINGGAKQDLTRWADGLTSVSRDITPLDSYFSNSDTVSVGDVVTLYAGTGTMTQSSPNFNLLSSGDYNMFIFDGTGGRISDVVPEPSVIALVGIFGGGLFGVRRIFMI